MIFKFSKKIAFTFRLIKNGHAANVWDAFVRRIRSEEIAYGFRRDLALEFAKPRALMQVEVRAFKPGDEIFFTERRNDGLINEFQTCYVAVAREGTPCFHLWLIDPSQNNKLKKIWGNTFPKLEEGELLVENVYTVPKYRGMGIFPVVLHDIVQKGRELGAKSLISFGETRNVNMSRSFVYAGFEPYVLRRKKWFLFIKTISFEEIPKEMRDTFNLQTKVYRAKPLLKEDNR